MCEEKNTSKQEDKEVDPITLNVGQLPSEERAERRKREKAARRAGILDIVFTGVELIVEAISIL